MRNLVKLLVGQGVSIPIWAVIAFTSGVFVAGYSPLSQHLSELGVPASPVAPFVNALLVLLGLSICGFAAGALGLPPASGVWLSPPLMMLFGASTVSNGMAPMGTPAHGLYGAGVAIIIAPAIFASEARAVIKSRAYEVYSHATTVASLFYLWINLAGLDPQGYRGLTQRLAGMVTYLWLGVSALLLWKSLRGSEEEPPRSRSVTTL